MKTKLLLLWLLVSVCVKAQVGVNTASPNAQLDIRSSNQAAPANTDGVLIPKVDAFPATNPTVAQQGMLVYLNVASGGNPIGFYYWNNPTATWLPLKGTDGGTLDQAYDFGGAGVGRTITADAGAVTINGNDGLVANGTFGSGAFAPTGAGTKMFWNPRKSAFRAGEATGIEWNDPYIGRASVAFGQSNMVDGNYAAAFGRTNESSAEGSFSAGISNIASGYAASALGQETIASGSHATAFGQETQADGNASVSFGFGNLALGNYSSVSGYGNTSASYAETVLGIGATNYTTSPNGNSEFNEFNQLDRLFVVGNAIDMNYNTIVDPAERSDALIIQKNGLTRLPSTTNAMINAADGKAVVTKEWIQANTGSGGTLDQAYDFGGAGAGRTITADAGAVMIAGADGLVSTGILGSGAVAPTGAGIKMYWNPRKAAFRAGEVQGMQWNDANVGDRSIAFGRSTTASGLNSVATGGDTTATGINSVAFGSGTNAGGSMSAAFGSNTIASGTNSVAFGFNNTASAVHSFAFGSNTTASAQASTAFGFVTTASGDGTTAFGANTTASGRISTAFGRQNTAPSYGETVLGIGATTYTTTTNGDVAFGGTNRLDRLFVVGNAIDTNDNTVVDPAERSDALIILKNGLTRLPSTTNAMINAADGKAVVTKEWVQGNTAGTLDSAYDFGGAGAGRTITADTGAVLVEGEDGFQVTGTLAAGATLNLTGPGTRMFFYPRKAAFRAGNVSGTQWNDANIGNLSIAFGNNTQASGPGAVAFGYASVSSGSYSTAFGSNSTASGTTSTSFGSSTMASGNNSFAFGLGADASGIASTAFGQNSNATGTYSTSWGDNTDASGAVSTTWGSGTEASGGNATAFGHQTMASGHDSAAWGYQTEAAGDHASAFGVNNSAPSFSETVLGIGATTYTPSVNGNTSWGTANATDRLLVVGNSIDTNNNNVVDAAERSNALTILKNGRVALGNVAPGGQFELSLNEGRKPGSGTWTIVSDERLKTVDGDYTAGLSEIRQLRPIRYHYKNVNGRIFEPKILATEFSGFLAQDVQRIFPSCVERDTDGYLSLNIHDIIIASVNAVKELDAKNTQLTTENATLKSELTEQKELLKSLVQRIEALERK